jgi:membrane protease subunit HflK
MEMKGLLERMRQSQPPGQNVDIKKVIKIVRIVLIVLILAVVLKSSIYTIPTDSEGVIKRFGLFSRITQPGIHLKIPFGIETATAVPVKKVQKEEFGFRTVKAGVDSTYIGAEEVQSGRAPHDALMKVIHESGERVSGGNIATRARDILRAEYIMLTGDLNIVDVEWIVQYKIKDARQYLFNIKEAKHTIRDASQSVMRQLIGNGSVDEAITIGRIEYEIASLEGLQKILDEYETGIHVVTVKMQSSNPPLKVRPAFNEVNKSLQQKEQRSNEAMKDYNEAIPRTGGEAKKMIETARGYAAERVNEAEGDIAKFDMILAEYIKAPDITRQRMYLETMGKLLPQISEKWIIEQGGADGGILMRLGLDGTSQ